MGAIDKFCRRQLKQYGKNIKAFETQDFGATPDYIVELFKKHNINLASRTPVIPIPVLRWGFKSREEKNTIKDYEDLVNYSKPLTLEN